MIERVIENWLTSINERQYQLPFCQVLEAEGERVIYISSHGPLELGKDIVTVGRDGVANAYQLKAGAIAMTEWRSFKGEIEQLVEYPIDIPARVSKRRHRPFFVSNGRVNEVVTNAVKTFNRGLKQRGFNELTIVGGSELLSRFKEAHGKFLPREPGDLKMFLELYVRDGRKPLDKAKLAMFLERVLAFETANRSQKDVERAAASIVLLTAYINHDSERRSNFWAIFEAWVITAAYIIALATKYSASPSSWKKSFDLCMQGAFRALNDLAGECEKNDTQLVALDMLDGAFYAIRITILCGLLSAWDLAQQKQAGHKPSDFVAKFLDKFLPDSKLWGESAVPLYIVTCLALSRNGRQHNAEGLALQLARALANGEKFWTRGVPNPYYGPEAAFRLLNGFDELNTEDFRGLSYNLELPIQFLARRWLRQHLAVIWPQISTNYYATFVPSAAWQWFIWRSRDGALKWTAPGKPQSWTSLLKESDEPESHGAPGLFSKEMVFTLYFVMVFPQRCHPHMIAALERWLSD